MSRPAAGTDVLFVCEYFAPAVRAGGGARVLMNTVAHLGERFRFAVVTRNHDVGSSQPFEALPSERWVRMGRAEVYYAPDRKLTLRELRRLVHEVEPRAIYLNSLFSVLAIRILVLRRAGRLGSASLVVAPEGELGPGALAIRPLRKRLYLSLARALGLFRGIAWKAASEPEAERIRAWFGAPLQIAVAASLSPPATLAAAPEAPVRGLARRRRGEVKLLFLSRISPKKNLLFLLEALRCVRVPVYLGIAGPIEDRAYWRRCESALARLPAHVQVSRFDALPAEEVPALLAQFDVLALPTRDENYGYVILEALAAGCRLLVSPHTPWSDLEREGVGRILEVARPEAWGAEIEALADWPDEAFTRQRELAASYARRHLASDQPVRELERLLSEAVTRAR